MTLFDFVLLAGDIILSMPFVIFVTLYALVLATGPEMKRRWKRK